MMIYDIPPFQEQAIGLYLPPSEKLPGYVGTTRQISTSTFHPVKVPHTGNELVRRYGAEGQERPEILKGY